MTRTARIEELLAQTVWLERLARRLVGNAEGADELVQGTWLAALERPPRMLQGEAGLRRWLAQVMRNVARQRARGEDRRRARERAAARAEAQPGGDDVVARVAVQQQLVAAVMALAEPYRSTVLRRYFDEVPAERLAEMDGVTPVAIRQRLARAFAMLRVKLDEEHDGDRQAWCLALAPLARAGGRSLTGASALGALMGWKFTLVAVVAGIALVVGLPWVLAARTVGSGTRPAGAQQVAVGSLANDGDDTAAKEESHENDRVERVALAASDEQLEAAAEPPPLTTAVSGRVIDADGGAPIAGARVVASEELWTESDASGRFRLEGVSTRGMTWIHASQDAFIPDRVRVLAQAADPNRLEIALERGVLRTVEVFDAATGQPIAGARVDRNGPEHLARRTDTDGRFSLRVSPDNGSTVYISSPDHLTLTWSWDPGSLRELEGELPYRLPMRRRAWIEGRVSDVTGAPVAKCELRGVNDGMAIDQRMGRDEQRAHHLPGHVYYQATRDSSPVQTDEQGVFAIPVMASASPYHVVCSHTDFITARSKPLVLEEPGQRVRVALELERGGTIRGLALHNGERWRGRVEWQIGERAESGHVNADGRFELINVPPGVVRVGLCGSGGTLLGARELEVEAERESTVELRWDDERGRITGHVLSTDGSPRVGEEVTARSVDPDGSSVPYSAVTGARGEYELTLPPGLYAVSAGEGRTMREEEPVRTGTSGVDLVLADLGTLRLKFVDAETRTVLRAPSIPYLQAAWRPSGTGEFSPLFLSIASTIDSTGHAKLRFPAGFIDLRMDWHDEGYQLVDLRDVPVPVEAGDDALVIELLRGSELELRLQTGDPGGRVDLSDHLLFLLEEHRIDAVRGPFEEQDGAHNRIESGLPIWIEDVTLMSRRVRPNEVGVDVLRGLAPGRYVLRAIPDDLRFEPVRIELLPGPNSAVEVVWRAR